MRSIRAATVAPLADLPGKGVERALAGLEKLARTKTGSIAAVLHASKALNDLNADYLALVRDINQSEQDLLSQLEWTRGQKVKLRQIDVAGKTLAKTILGEADTLRSAATHLVHTLDGITQKKLELINTLNAGVNRALGNAMSHRMGTLVNQVPGHGPQPNRRRALG